MTDLTSLPVEILSEIVGYLEKKSLASVRLTNRVLNDIAARHLFSSVTLYVSFVSDNDFEDEDEDYPYCEYEEEGKYDPQIFRNILESEMLNKYVKKVDVYLCKTHCDHNPNHKDMNILHNYDPEYSNEWWSCIRDLKTFPSLSAVNIHFDHHASEASYHEFRDILHEPQDRLELSHQIFSYLKGPNAPRIRHLGIRHYQDEGLAEKDHPERRWVLEGLESLRMSISHKEIGGEGDYGDTLREGDPHTFWRHFPTNFLKPTIPTLQKLVLYSNLPLGFFPSIDLTNLHFPHLRYLCLGNFMFAQEAQFDWIISHAATLQELYLDQCAILYQVGYTIRGWLGENGFPIAHPPGDQNYYGKSFTPLEDHERNGEIDELLKLPAYATRWSDVFARFKNELPHLLRFAFGRSGKWKHRVESRCGPFGSLPMMPWEAEEEIERYSWRDNYKIYCDWDSEYRGRWEEEIDFDEWRYQPIERWIKRFESYPHCEIEDISALEGLLEAIKRRGGSGMFG
ncbi:hypothetical protein DM02DRAFT_618595 [Periconia macrospinosa]|uniref:F-box domain-containing protein n=1 Tax=Periconia macrospinosa TaxID=97972 RepID=A0A2V1D8U5_9PLEO|nr:hypothetical protein DM02DRAFT_618595 [Periconia macrospinosa]